MPLILNKRRKTIRQQDCQDAGQPRNNVVSFPVARAITFDPLDRLVVFLAKRTAEQDHKSEMEEDRSCEP